MMEDLPEGKPRATKATKRDKAAAPRPRRSKTAASTTPELSIAGTVVELNPGQEELVKSLVAEFARRLEEPTTGAAGSLSVEADLPGLGEFWLHQLEALALRQQALRALYDAS